jgi:hypothetical protein
VLDLIPPSVVVVGAGTLVRTATPPDCKPPEKLFNPDHVFDPFKNGTVAPLVPVLTVAAVPNPLMSATAGCEELNVPSADRAVIH